MNTTFIPSEAEANEHSNDDRLPTFVYGTLRPDFGNSRQWQGLAYAKFDGKCRIEDHRLVSNGGFPYCLPTEGEVSYGCLIVPTADNYDEVMHNMDRLEGVPRHYTRETVAVITPEGIVSAWVYIPAHPESYAGLDPVFGNDWALHVRRQHTNLDAGWHA